MKQKRQHKKFVVPAVAVAGILSLGGAPVWAQQSDRKSTQSSAAEDGMITAGALEGTKVLDKRNREIGSIDNLYIDPASGQVVRAGIEFNKETFDGKKYSVAWSDLQIKRQDGKLVVALDESVIDRVQNAAQTDTGSRRQETTGRQQQRENSSQQQKQADRGSGVLGFGGSDSERDQQRVSASQLSSQQIRKIQQELNKEGFDAGQVDGKWNSETQSALRNFQESKGLRATGELDQRTIKELGLDADEFQQKSQSGNDRSYQKDQSGSDSSTRRESYYPGSGVTDSSSPSSSGSSR